MEKIGDRIYILNRSEIADFLQKEYLINQLRIPVNKVVCDTINGCSVGAKLQWDPSVYDQLGFLFNDDYFTKLVKNGKKEINKNKVQTSRQFYSFLFSDYIDFFYSLGIKITHELHQNNFFDEMFLESIIYDAENRRSNNNGELHSSGFKFNIKKESDYNALDSIKSTIRTMSRSGGSVFLIEI